MSPERLAGTLPDACRAAMPRNACISDSVHGLLTISRDFMRVSGAGRDDADDFFAILPFSIHVHNQEDSGPAGFETNGAEGVPALLAGFGVDPLRTDEAELVFKYEGSPFE